MANTIANTVFELNVISEGESEVIVPNTGSFTGTIESQTNINNGAFAIIFAIIAVLSVIISIICRKLSKKTKGFQLSNKKYSIASLAFIIVFLFSIGLLGKMIVVDSNFTQAITNNIDVSLAVDKEKIIINKNKSDDSFTQAKVKVALAKPQQSGYIFNDYILYMEATELKDEYGNTIGTIDATELPNNAWGYKVSENETNYREIPYTKSMISSATWNNDIEEVEISFYVKLSPEIADGKYTSTINFRAVSNGREEEKPVVNYIVSIQSSDNDRGSVSPSQLIVPEGTAVVVSLNKTFTLNGTTIRAIPNTNYDFSSWTNNCGSTVTSDCTIVANFIIKTYTITWDANGGTVLPTSSAKAAGSTLGTLPVPTYSGYNFLGWFTASSGGTQISNTTVVTGNITYYAHWEVDDPFGNAFKNAGKVKQDGYYKMQDMTAGICSAVATPTSATEDISIQLVDTRDNKIYWVSKLMDENCWMTQNLDYDIKSTQNEISMIDGTTSTWSNIGSETSTTIFDNQSNAGTKSYDPGNKYVINSSGTRASISCTTSSNGGENCHYHLGNYYQWNAATGGTGGTITASSEEDAPILNAEGSICPKGWRLPVGGNKSYADKYGTGRMTDAYGLTEGEDNYGRDLSNIEKLLTSPLYFVYSGFVAGKEDFETGGPEVYRQTDSGTIWSSSASSDVMAAGAFSFDALFNRITSNYSRRYYGLNVRCVAQ